MTSPRQRAANRLNSLRASGPKTLAGKRRSAINATRHGLTVPIDVSGWAPLLEPLAKRLIADGYSAAQARDLARGILDFERNVKYQRERFQMAQEGREAVPDVSRIGQEELFITGRLTEAIRNPKKSKKNNYLGFGKEAAWRIRAFFRQLAARKVRQAVRDARHTFRNADRHLRRSANQLIRLLGSTDTH